MPDWDEQYHSKHGAIQEANHVFLETGLSYFNKQYPEKKNISVLEMGFGTGLNALLTYYKAKDLNLAINYTGVEAFPISSEEAAAMDYASQLPDKSDALEIYNTLHSADWENEVAITANFNLTKRKQTFDSIEDLDTFDLVFFDAFGPRVHPDAWTEEIFSIMYKALQYQGVLTTYCAQGAARRAMQAVGFTVERLPGPPGKREMLRASKI